MISSAAKALTAAGQILVIRYDLLKRTHQAGVPGRLQKRALAQTQAARNALTNAFKWYAHARKLHDELGLRGEDSPWLQHPWLVRHVQLDDPECKRAVTEAMEELMGQRALSCLDGNCHRVYMCIAWLTTHEGACFDNFRKPFHAS